MSGQMDAQSRTDPVADLRARRARTETEMGGSDRIGRLHAAGRRTAREHIAALTDPGSFVELGTFAVSERPEDRDATPGDGKICGQARIEGRPVTLAVDDVTVKRATSSLVGARKLERTYELARRTGTPFVHVGETGGARLPDTLGAVAYSSEPVFPWLMHRRREIPVATAIVGGSFGGSSFIAAMSDLVVQVAGSTLAVTSPRVIEVATGERVSDEELGGTEVHAVRTGQIDVVAADDDEAYAAIARFLSHLPSHAGGDIPRTDPGELAPDPQLGALVPRRRTRAYDVRRVLARIVDGGELLELKPRFGPSLVTALARIGGHPVGVVASQPVQSAGTLTPDACSKAARLVCLCDAFGLPVVFLQDTPGFLVGTEVEHDRMLARAMLLTQAVALARVPTISVVLRKAFGLAFFALGGPHMGTDLVLAWPGAEIGFMDPEVGANVLHGATLEGLPGDTRRQKLAELAEGLSAEFDPYAVAGAMNLDEIIDPADTRVRLAHAIGLLTARPPTEASSLAAWPLWW